MLRRTTKLLMLPEYDSEQKMIAPTMAALSYLKALSQVPDRDEWPILDRKRTQHLFVSLLMNRFYLHHGYPSNLNSERSEFWSTLQYVSADLWPRWLIENRSFDVDTAYSTALERTLSFIQLLESCLVLELKINNQDVPNSQVINVRPIEAKDLKKVKYSGQNLNMGTGLSYIYDYTVNQCSQTEVQILTKGYNKFIDFVLIKQPMGKYQSRQALAEVIFGEHYHPSFTEVANYV